MTTKEDIPKRVTAPMLEQLALLMETNRKQSEIIESQAKTIEELRATIVWKSHATLTLLATQDCPLWLQYD